MTIAIRKALVPAAGLGTRFLPATKAIPKEMIPVIDRPGIQYVVEECARAGIQEIVVVTSKDKAAIEDHFAPSPGLEEHLRSAGKTEELEFVRYPTTLAQMRYVIQDEPKGFGHAVLMARDAIGDEPFVCLVPDEIVPERADGGPSLLEGMMAAHEEKEASIIAVLETAADELSSYGVVDPAGPQDGALVPMRGMVEKPAPGTEPSNLAARGRYVFTPDIFELIEQTPPGVNGEIQLTDAVNAQARLGGVLAYVHDGPIFDVGRKLDLLKASVRLALDRPDMGTDLAEWLRTLIAEA
ncbi:MAG TPA: UTP--glucose-1-phosphate uridylyltransferase [Actinomycetota bacterium]|nr:UTP--glucose-1-phosphate uridylyltransferase [Actinomycetota bacterium]